MKADNAQQGNISKIEPMGLVDGPGFRMVVFLSGCHLRCSYCHNPETWDINHHTVRLTPEELYEKYKRYEVYYGRTGGITFSGGEPLLQHDFLLAATRLFHERGVHIALDTAGVAENYADILKFVDLILLDVKAVNGKEYEQITGHTQDDFNKFIEVCMAMHKPLWIRQVIVPGINDDREHVLLLKEYLKKIEGVQKVELLPYHTLGKQKYAELNLVYPLKDVKDMDKERCKELENLLK